MRYLWLLTMSHSKFKYIQDYIFPFALQKFVSFKSSISLIYFYEGNLKNKKIIELTCNVRSILPSGVLEALYRSTLAPGNKRDRFPSTDQKSEGLGFPSLPHSKMASLPRSMLWSWGFCRSFGGAANEITLSGLTESKSSTAPFAPSWPGVFSQIQFSHHEFF